MKLLSFSGAGTKIISHVVHSENILKTYDPDIICGISSGSLIMFPALLGKFDLLKDFTLNLRLEDIFFRPPVDADGNLKISSFYNLIMFGSFGLMRGEFGIEQTIKKFVSKEEFEKVINSNKKIYVGVNNVTKNKFDLVCLNDKTYEEAIIWMIASCSVPIYVPPIKIGDSFYNDGGVRMFTASPCILKLYKEQITHCISVYSIEHHFNKKIDPKFDGTSMGRNMSKAFEGMQDSIFEMNVDSEIQLCEKYNIQLDQRFSFDVMKGVYDIDKTRLLELKNKIESTYL